MAIPERDPAGLGKSQPTQLLVGSRGNAGFGPQVLESVMSPSYKCPQPSAAQGRSKTVCHSPLPLSPQIPALQPYPTAQNPERHDLPCFLSFDRHQSLGSSAGSISRLASSCLKSGPPALEAPACPSLALVSFVIDSARHPETRVPARRVRLPTGLLILYILSLLIAALRLMIILVFWCGMRLWSGGISCGLLTSGLLRALVKHFRCGGAPMDPP